MSVRDIRAESLAEKRRQKETNPCFEEQNKSLKCFELNANDSDKCRREVENMQMCKAFWHEVARFRRKHNIQPFTPVPEERAQMRTKYMSTGSVKPIIEDMKRQYDL